METGDTVVSSSSDLQKLLATSEDSGFPVETTPTTEQSRPTAICTDNPVTEPVITANGLVQAVSPDKLENSGSSTVDVGTLVPKNMDVEEKPACAEDGLIIGQYLSKKRAVVKIKHLSEISVDIWCNHVSNYYEYQPIPDPPGIPVDVKPTLVKGYGSTKGPHVDENKATEVKHERVTSPVETDDIDNLLSQAENLVNKAKDLANATDSSTKRKKSTLKRKGKKPVRSQAVSHVGTVTDALDVLHQKTMDKLTPVGAEPRKLAHARIIYGKMCTETFSSVGELNKHHRDDHGVVSCKDCDKKFSIQTSLDKHTYTHGDLKYVCELCGKKFPFASRLEQHSKVHINQKMPCPIKSCKNVFKGVGDVNQHVKTHKKGGWFECKFCDYRNKDKRNTDSHAYPPE